MARALRKKPRRRSGSITKRKKTTSEPRMVVSPFTSVTERPRIDVRSVLNVSAERLTPSWIKKLIWATVAFIIVVLGSTILFLFVYFGGNSGGVRIEVEVPDEVRRGVPFEVVVNVENRAETLAQESEVTISVSEGVVYMGDVEEGEFVRDELGSMGSGSVTRRVYKFLAVGEADAVEEISFKLSYLSGRKTRFETRDVAKIRIVGETIPFTITVPDQILSGSTFDIKIDYENVSDFDFPEIAVGVEYPTSFTFIRSSLRPDSLNNYWRLGELRKNSSGDLTIGGSLVGREGDRFVLPVRILAEFLGREYVIAEEEVELAVAPSPLAIEINLNRSVGYVARVGEVFSYIIRYRNNSGIALADVVLEAKLVGELFDLTTVGTDADFDLRAQSVYWNASHISSFRLLDPNTSGEVTLMVKLKDNFPIERLNDKNFRVRLDVVMSSPSVPYYLSAPETKAIASIETKVRGQIAVDAKVFYRDAAAGIVNLGSVPPKVGVGTQYTIHWVLRNYSTDVSNISVGAFLPPEIRPTGIVKSNTDSIPFYNEETGEMLWTIEEMRATQGVLDAPLEAVFQIEGVPTTGHVGIFQPLVGVTSMRAHDEFTGVELGATDVALDTSLPDDITIAGDMGKIVP